jgi:hypothetical protein
MENKKEKIRILIEETVRLSIEEVKDFLNELDGEFGLEDKRKTVKSLMKKMKLDMDFPTKGEIITLKTKLGIKKEDIYKYYDYGPKIRDMIDSVYEKRKVLTVYDIKKISFAGAMKKEVYNSIYYNNGGIEGAKKRISGLDLVIDEYMTGNNIESIEELEKGEKDGFMEFVKNGKFRDIEKLVVARSPIDESEMDTRDVLMKFGTEVIREGLGADSHIVILAKELKTVVLDTPEEDLRLNRIRFLPFSGRAGHGKDYILEKIKESIKRREQNEFTDLVDIKGDFPELVIGIPDVRMVNEAIFTSMVAELLNDKKGLIKYLEEVIDNFEPNREKYNRNFDKYIGDIPGSDTMKKLKHSFLEKNCPFEESYNKEKSTIESRAGKREREAIKRNLRVVEKSIEFTNMDNIKGIISSETKTVEDLIEAVKSQYRGILESREVSEGIIEAEVTQIGKNARNIFSLSGIRPKTQREEKEMFLKIITEYGNTRSNPYHFSEKMVENLSKFMSKREINKIKIRNNIGIKPEIVSKIKSVKTQKKGFGPKKI